MHQQLIEESQNLRRRFKKNWSNSFLGIQQQEEAYLMMKEASKIRRRRRVEVGHSVFEEDHDDPEAEDFIFQVQTNVRRNLIF